MARKVRKLGRPAGSSREDTIARALVSARRLFATKGYAGTTLKDVAHDMGVTHATLYRYFDSKVDLYCQTIDATQELLRPEFEAVLSMEGSCKQRLIELLRVALGDRDPESGRSAFLAAVPIELMRHDDLRRAIDYEQNRMAQTLLTLFSEGLDRGEIVADATAEDLMVLFMGGLLGMNVFHQGGRIGSMEKVFELFVSMFDHGVFAVDELA